MEEFNTFLSSTNAAQRALYARPAFAARLRDMFPDLKERNFQETQYKFDRR
jgi:hypothetical protein